MDASKEKELWVHSVPTSLYAADGIQSKKFYWTRIRPWTSQITLTSFLTFFFSHSKIPLAGVIRRVACDITDQIRNESDDKCTFCPPAVRTSHWSGTQETSRLAQQGCCFFFLVPVVHGSKWYFYSAENLPTNTKEFECSIRPKWKAIRWEDIKLWGLPVKDGSCCT